ncbi:hypothetical protein [Mesorhizobium sp. M0435]
MGYKSIVLNLDIDGMVAPVIKLGVDLAQHSMRVWSVSRLPTFRRLS